MLLIFNFLSRNQVETFLCYFDIKEVKFYWTVSAHVVLLKSLPLGSKVILYR